MEYIEEEPFFCSLTEGKEKEGSEEGEEGQTDPPGRICLLDLFSQIIREFWLRRTHMMNNTENGMKTGGVRRPGRKANSATRMNLGICKATETPTAVAATEAGV